MPDHRQLLRQWFVLRRLSRHSGAAVRELAEEFGVDPKTIRRDLQTLSSAGFAMVEDVGPHGKKFRRLQFANGSPQPDFTYDELAVLHLGRRFLEPLAGTTFGMAAGEAFRKIRAALSDKQLRYLEKLADVLHRTTFGSGDYAKQSEVLDALQVAAEDRRIVLLGYRSLRTTEPVTYEVYPLGLVNHRDSLYLIAFSTGHDETRTFKVDRIESAEAQTRKFEIPAGLDDFDMERFLSRGLGIFEKPGPPRKVRIRFAPEVARHVEESHWHPTQTLTRRPDGSLLAEFELTALEEVKSWVLSFGANAEVLEPEGLRKAMTADLIRALQQYEREVTLDTHSHPRP